MKVEVLTSSSTVLPMVERQANRQTEEAPQQKPQQVLPDASVQDAKEAGRIAPEELLDRINSLTENGNYSVHFEKDRDLNELVVRLVDTETGEVIRQIPPEELLESSKRLEDFRGLVFKTRG